MKVLIIEDFGAAKKGNRYDVVETGVDSYGIRCRGKKIYVPKSVCRSPVDTNYFEDEDEFSNENISFDSFAQEY